MRIYLAWMAMVVCGDVLLAGVQDDLNRRMRGAWVIIGTEVYSRCDGRHTNNDIQDRLVVGKGGHRFAPGELGKIAKVDLKRSRVDVLIQLAEPRLEDYEDGPFTLYREVDCKVELRIDLARELVRNRDLQGIESAIRRVLVTYPDRASAKSSPVYNGRLRADYPEDYDQTLAEHARWLSQETNRRIDETIAASRREVARILDQVREEEEYAGGFMAGIKLMRDQYNQDDCEQLLRRTFFSQKRPVPGDPSENYKQGHLDGQALVFHLNLAERLQGCYILITE